MATIKGSVEFDIKSFRDAMKEMRNELKLVESESTSLSSSMLADGRNVDTLGKAIDGARKKVKAYGEANDVLKKYIKQLNTQIEEQKSKINETTKALKTAQTETGDESDEVKNLSKELTSLNRGLDQMENALNQSKRALNDNTTALNKAQSEVNQLDTEIKSLNVNPLKKLKSAVDDVTNSTSKSNSGFTVLKGTLSNLFSNLVSGAFNIGKQMVGSVVSTGVQYQSDLAEVQNVVTQSFQDSSGVIDKWSKDLLGTFGMNELSAKRYASVMGAMLQSANPDMDSSDIAKYTTDVVERMADMASFYNYDLDEMFQKVQAGIAGEIEPLRRIGINMGATELEAYAMSKGLNKAWDELSEGEKQLYRINYLLERSAAAMGDYARTSDELANAQRTAGETFQIISGQLAQGINEILKVGLNAFNDWYQNNGGAQKIEEMADHVLNKFRELSGGLSGLNFNSIFDSIVTGVGDVIIWLMDLVSWLIQNKDAILDFATAALKIWGVVKVMQALNTASQFLSTMFSVFKAILGVFTAGAGGGLLATLGTLALKLVPIIAFFQVWNGLLSPLVDGLQGLLGYISDSGIPILSDLAEALDWIIEKAQAALDFVGGLLSLDLNQMGDAWSSFWGGTGSPSGNIEHQRQLMAEAGGWYDKGTNSSTKSTTTVNFVQNNYSPNNLNAVDSYRNAKRSNSYFKQAFVKGGAWQ